MALTEPPASSDASAAGLIDGHTLEELSAYLESGMTPADPSIDESPACRLALDALLAVEAATSAELEREAAAMPPLDTAWLRRIVDAISLNVLPGRSIPLRYPEPGLTLTTTESAVRGLVRAVGDETAGVIVGRCILDGDVTVPGSPLRVQVEAAVRFGRNIPETADALRRAIVGALRDQAGLFVTDVDVVVHDVYAPGLEGGSA